MPVEPAVVAGTWRARMIRHRHLEDPTLAGGEQRGELSGDAAPVGAQHGSAHDVGAECLKGAS